MSRHDWRYNELVQHVLDTGVERTDRTGTGTLSVFGTQTRYDLREGFPLLTTKKVHFNSIKAELLWFLRGDTNVESLQADGCTIWDEWADERGDLGPVYGAQWRSFGEDTVSGRIDPVDQIADVIEQIKTNPDSRRLIVSAWNPTEIGQMALPPCHMIFQFYVQDGRLSCHLNQRSGDIFLGVPFNIASYALLTHMIAQVTGLEVGEFVHTIGDAHIYLNHLDQVREQMSRSTYRPAPRLVLNPEIKDIDDFTMADISIEDYDPFPAIKAPVAV